MSRRANVLLTTLAAGVLCVSSYEIAGADAPLVSVPKAEQGVSACATDSGHLRLADSSGHCSHGLSKVSLARLAALPKSMRVRVTSGSTTRLIKIGTASVSAHCELDPGTKPSDNESSGQLDAYSPRGVHFRGDATITSIGSTAYFKEDPSASPYQLAQGYNVLTSDVGGGVDITGGYESTIQAQVHAIVNSPGGSFVMDAYLLADQGVCEMDVQVTPST